jgi:uncharacterized protein (TIGR00369 family)
MIRPKTTDEFNKWSQGMLPAHLGIEILSVSQNCVTARLPIVRKVMAPNGYLHAGTIVSLADTACGYGTVANLPDGAYGFTTIELKSNFINTAREGMLHCVAVPLHQGRTTQVWNARITHQESGRVLTEFICTQLVLWPQS